jgi:hypothetical protein
MTSRTRFVVSSVALLASVAAYADTTYSKDISRIYRAKCELCHREGDIAPFALSNYDAAMTWSADIARVLRTGIMPPWKPRPGVQHYRNDYSLSDDEKQMIFDWMDAGSPEGDPADLPDPLDNKSPWAQGQPDQVLTMTQPYTPPIGSDVYRCFVLNPGNTQKMYLNSIDFLPGDRSIVHHSLLYAETPDKNGVYPSDKWDGVDGQPGYDCFGGPGFNIDLTNIKSLLGGWAPGTRPYKLPEQYGIEVPANAKIIMQLHYFPVGHTGTDQTSIGLYFSPRAPDNTLLEIPVLQQSFKIPANADNYNVDYTFVLDARAWGLPVDIGDTTVIWAYPHMHLLGQQISVNVTNPDKTSNPLIAIDAWDFNWQGAYSFENPVVVKQGSTINLHCNYDNSANNVRNPNNPIIPVGWGERTTDEMCIAFVGLVNPRLEALLNLLAH